jgi:Trypsin-co-occurring domain 2
MPDETAPIPLSDAIRALRSQVTEAMRESYDEDVRFKLGPIELEFAVEAGRTAGGEAGIAFWVIKLGGRGERSSATTHTVKLVLTPVGPEGDVLVSDKERARPE